MSLGAPKPPAIIPPANIPTRASFVSRGGVGRPLAQRQRRTTGSPVIGQSKTAVAKPDSFLKPVRFKKKRKGKN